MKRTALAISIGAICTGLAMGTWAQDPPDAETQENQMESQQPASEQDNEMEVTQSEPNEEIQKAEPEDTAEDSSETEVTIESSGESEVTVEEESKDEQEETQQESTSSQSSALMSLRVSDLEGMNITNQDDEKIGKVGQISQHNQSGDLYAIVGVGGFTAIPVEIGR
jgi:ribosomal 30S subunit maturation factor RimM